MTEVEISKDIVMAATELAIEMGQIHNSITSGQGNIAGFIGELIAVEYYGGLRLPTKDYDILLDGKRIDVKTKRTSVKPKPEYMCSIATTSLHQDCDEYIFVRVKNDMRRAWVLGRISSQDFFENATLFRKGDIEGGNNFVVLQDCYSISISDLQKYNKK